MSVYLDTITVSACLFLLLVYANWLVKKPSKWAGWGFFTLSAYLFAQVGWTTAWLSGDVWGRDLSNYIWFAFNTSVCYLLYLIWRDKGNS